MTNIQCEWRSHIQNKRSYIKVESEYYDFSIGLVYGYSVIPKEENTKREVDFK